jgi:hypothetical protein
LTTPADPRRFIQAGDDQINGVGDAIGRNIPPGPKDLKNTRTNTVLFGSVCEAYEYLWRCIGTMNSLTWPLEEPELFGDCRLADRRLPVRITPALRSSMAREAQGHVHLGRRGLRQRHALQPQPLADPLQAITKRLIDICHEADLMVVYHGCGNATAIYEDFIEMGLDAYNPLECKSHLDSWSCESSSATGLASGQHRRARNGIRRPEPHQARGAA